MLNIETLRTPIFLRLTGGKPKLTSPFAKNFSLDEWKSALIRSSDAKCERDVSLCLAAIFFGRNIAVLRQWIHGELFGEVSKRSLLILAVGSANRNFSALREGFKQKVKDTANDPEPHHIFELGKSGVENAPQSGMSSDDIVTSIVDSLPHWFFEARSLTGERESLTTDFWELEKRVAMGLSIEAGFRDLWNSALWEGSRLKTEGEKMVFGPSDHASSYFWYASQMRSEAAMLGPIALYHDMPEEREDLAEIKEAVALRRKGGGYNYLSRKPTEKSLQPLGETISFLEKSYVANFLDEELVVEGTAISARLLVQALWVFETLATSMQANLRSKFIRHYRDASDYSLRIPRASCVRLIRRCLGVGPDVAKAIFLQLTLDPNDTGKCFNEGVWLHPLVELDEDEVLLVHASIAVGSKLRFVERTLSELLGPDLHKASSQGIEFEKSVRIQLIENLKENDIISDFSILPHGLKKAEENGEEIDLLFRIGKKVILGELKCFLAPTEPMDRFNHLSKLEEAAAQVKRKATWLALNLDILEKHLGVVLGKDEIEIIPLVVLNQRIGSGLVIEGVAITDVFLLQLFAGSGSYNSGAAIGKGKKAITSTEFYRTQEQAEQAIPAVFSAPPPLKPFLDAADWTTFEYPISTGSLWVEKPCLKPSSLADPAMRLAADLISPS